MWLEGACPGVLGAVRPLNQEITRAIFACTVIQQRRRRNLLKQAVCRVSQHNSGQGHEPPTDDECNMQINPEHCLTYLLTPAATKYIMYNQAPTCHLTFLTRPQETGTSRPQA